MEEKKIVKEQTWSIKVTTHDDGTVNMERANDGFNALELLGVLSLTTTDVINQFRRVVRPDEVKRTVITD